MQRSSLVPISHDDSAEAFDLAPVSLWLEDYSGLKRLFAEWRDAGVTDLRTYLLDDPRQVRECSEQIKVLKVNRATLALFEADDLEHLVANLGRIFRDDMLKAHIEELVQLWEGKDHLYERHGQLRAVRPPRRRPAQGRCPARPRGSPGTGY